MYRDCFVEALYAGCEQYCGLSLLEELLLAFEESGFVVAALKGCSRVSTNQVTFEPPHPNTPCYMTIMNITATALYPVLKSFEENLQTNTTKKRKRTSK